MCMAVYNIAMILLYGVNFIVWTVQWYLSKLNTFGEFISIFKKELLFYKVLLLPTLDLD